MMAQFFEDILWAAMMIVARRHRRRLTYSRRRIFDEQLKPCIHATISYPDAFYHVWYADLKRAVTMSETLGL